MARRSTLAQVELVPFPVSQESYQQALDEIAAALIELNGQLKRKSASSFHQAMPYGPDSRTERPLYSGASR